MTDGILYQNTGQRHANHLIVSVYSLRRVWDGPVTIMAGDAPGIELARKIEADRRLGDINVVEWKGETRATASQSNMHYVNKTRVRDQSPYDRTVFLDADTLVVGDFSDLFPRNEFIHLTQFSNWVTTGKMISHRIKAWREHCPVEVAYMLATATPAINTGVFAFTKNTINFFKEWRETTLKNICFMCDELAAQLIYYKHPHQVFDERFNASAPHSAIRHGPIEWRQKLSQETGEPMGENPDPRIWHGHGFKFIKTPQGRAIWMPWYERAMLENIAGIQQFKNDKKAPYPGILKYVTPEKRIEYTAVS